LPSTMLRLCKMMDTLTATPQTCEADSAMRV
ncbi:hypothetical protein ACUW57_002333, partial [Staphylococcus epidermidis]